MGELIGRGADGRWVAGRSGNPGGRPRVPEALRVELEAGASDAVELLRQVVRDGRVVTLAVVRAAELLVTRAYGRPGLEVASRLPAPLTLEAVAEDGDELGEAVQAVVEAWADAHVGDPPAAGIVLATGSWVSWQQWDAVRGVVVADLADALDALVLARLVDLAAPPALAAPLAASDSAAVAAPEPPAPKSPVVDSGVPRPLGVVDPPGVRARRGYVDLSR